MDIVVFEKYLNYNKDRVNITPIIITVIEIDEYNTEFICNKFSQFWDPIYKGCYNIFCGFLYNNIGGYCEYRNITREHLMGLNQHYKTEKETHKIKTCTMISLHDWEIW